MVDATKMSAQWPIPTQRPETVQQRGGCADRRPRLLRWLMPYSCATSVPLTGMESARMKFIAYH